MRFHTRLLTYAYIVLSAISFTAFAAEAECKDGLCSPALLNLNQPGKKDESPFEINTVLGKRKHVEFTDETWELPVFSEDGSGRSYPKECSAQQTYKVRTPFPFAKPKDRSKEPLQIMLNPSQDPLVDHLRDLKEQDEAKYRYEHPTVEQKLKREAELLRDFAIALQCPPDSHFIQDVMTKLADLQRIEIMQHTLLLDRKNRTVGSSSELIDAMITAIPLFQIKSNSVRGAWSNAITAQAERNLALADKIKTSGFGGYLEHRILPNEPMTFKSLEHEMKNYDQRMYDEFQVKIAELNTKHRTTAEVDPTSRIKLLAHNLGQKLQALKTKQMNPNFTEDDYASLKLLNGLISQLFHQGDELLGQLTMAELRLLLHGEKFNLPDSNKDQKLLDLAKSLMPAKANNVEKNMLMNLGDIAGFVNQVVAQSGGPLLTQKMSVFSFSPDESISMRKFLIAQIENLHINRSSPLLSEVDVSNPSKRLAAKAALERVLDLLDKGAPEYESSDELPLVTDYAYDHWTTAEKLNHERKGRLKAADLVMKNSPMSKEQAIATVDKEVDSLAKIAQKWTGYPITSENYRDLYALPQAFRQDLIVGLSNAKNKKEADHVLAAVLKPSVDSYSDALTSSGKNTSTILDSIDKTFFAHGLTRNIPGDLSKMTLEQKNALADWAVTQLSVPSTKKGEVKLRNLPPDVHSALNLLVNLREEWGHTDNDLSLLRTFRGKDGVRGLASFNVGTYLAEKEARKTASKENIGLVDELVKYADTEGFAIPKASQLRLLGLENTILTMLQHLKGIAKSRGIQKEFIQLMVAADPLEVTKFFQRHEPRLLSLLIEKNILKISDAELAANPAAARAKEVMEFEKNAKNSFVLEAQGTPLPEDKQQQINAQFDFLGKQSAHQEVAANLQMHPGLLKSRIDMLKKSEEEGKKIGAADKKFLEDYSSQMEELSLTHQENIMNNYRKRAAEDLLTKAKSPDAVRKQLEGILKPVFGTDAELNSAIDGIIASRKDEQMITNKLAAEIGTFSIGKIIPKIGLNDEPLTQDEQNQIDAFVKEIPKLRDGLLTEKLNINRDINEKELQSAKEINEDAARISEHGREKDDHGIIRYCQCDECKARKLTPRQRAEEAKAKLEQMSSRFDKIKEDLDAERTALLSEVNNKEAALNEMSEVIKQTYMKNSLIELSARAKKMVEDKLAPELVQSGLKGDELEKRKQVLIGLTQNALIERLRLQQSSDSAQELLHPNLGGDAQDSLLAKKVEETLKKEMTSGETAIKMNEEHAVAQIQSSKNKAREIQSKNDAEVKRLLTILKPLDMKFDGECNFDNAKLWLLSETNPPTPTPWSDTRHPLSSDAKKLIEALHEIGKYSISKTDCYDFLVAKTKDMVLERKQLIDNRQTVATQDGLKAKRNSRLIELFESGEGAMIQNPYAMAGLTGLKPEEGAEVIFWNKEPLQKAAQQAIIDNEKIIENEWYQDYVNAEHFKRRNMNMVQGFVENARDVGLASAYDRTLATKERESYWSYPFWWALRKGEQITPNFVGNSIDYLSRSSTKNVDNVVEMSGGQNAYYSRGEELQNKVYRNARILQSSGDVSVTMDDYLFGKQATTAAHASDIELQKNKKMSEQWNALIAGDMNHYALTEDIAWSAAITAASMGTSAYIQTLVNAGRFAEAAKTLQMIQNWDKLSKAERASITLKASLQARALGMFTTVGDASTLANSGLRAVGNGKLVNGMLHGAKAGIPMVLSEVGYHHFKENMDEEIHKKVLEAQKTGKQVTLTDWDYKKLFIDADKINKFLIARQGLNQDGTALSEIEDQDLEVSKHLEVPYAFMDKNGDGKVDATFVPQVEDYGKYIQSFHHGYRLFGISKSLMPSGAIARSLDAIKAPKALQGFAELYAAAETNNIFDNYNSAHGPNKDFWSWDSFADRQINNVHTAVWGLTGAATQNVRSVPMQIAVGYGVNGGVNVLSTAADRLQNGWGMTDDPEKGLFSRLSDYWNNGYTVLGDGGIERDIGKAISHKLASTAAMDLWFSAGHSLMNSKQTRATNEARGTLQKFLASNRETKVVAVEEAHKLDIASNVTKLSEMPLIPEYVKNPVFDNSKEANLRAKPDMNKRLTGDALQTRRTLEYFAEKSGLTPKLNPGVVDRMVKEYQNAKSAPDSATRNQTLAQFVAKFKSKELAAEREKIYNLPSIDAQLLGGALIDKPGERDNSIVANTQVARDRKNLQMTLPHRPELYMSLEVGKLDNRFRYLVNAIGRLPASQIKEEHQNKFSNEFEAYRTKNPGKTMMDYLMDFKVANNYEGFTPRDFNWSSPTVNKWANTIERTRQQRKDKAEARELAEAERAGTKQAFAPTTVTKGTTNSNVPSYTYNAEGVKGRIEGSDGMVVRSGDGHIVFAVESWGQGFIPGTNGNGHAVVKTPQAVVEGTIEPVTTVNGGTTKYPQFKIVGKNGETLAAVDFKIAPDNNGTIAEIRVANTNETAKVALQEKPKVFRSQMAPSLAAVYEGIALEEPIPRGTTRVNETGKYTTGTVLRSEPGVEGNRKTAGYESSDGLIKLVWKISANPKADQLITVTIPEGETFTAIAAPKTTQSGASGGEEQVLLDATTRQEIGKITFRKGNKNRIIVKMNDGRNVSSFIQ